MSEPTDIGKNSYTDSDKASGSEGNGGASAGSGQDGMYSWVSPRLRQSGRESGPDVNPWGQDRKDDASFWTEHIQQEDAARNSAPDRGQDRMRSEQKADRHDRDRRIFPEQRKKPSAGRSWARLAAMALVFGLIAGIVCYGVIRLGYRIYPPAYPQAEAGDGGQDSSRAALPQAGTEPDAAGTESGGSDESVPDEYYHTSVTYNVDGGATTVVQGQTAEVTVTNTYEKKTGSLKITKKVTVNNQPVTDDSMDGTYNFTINDSAGNQLKFVKEDGCYVKGLVLKGEIIESRYQNYLTFMKEV